MNNKLSSECFIKGARASSQQGNEDHTANTKRPRLDDDCTDGSSETSKTIDYHYSNHC